MAEALRSRDSTYGGLAEDVGYLDVYGTIDEASWRDWLEAAKEAGAEAISIEFRDQHDELVPPGDPFIGRIKIRVHKPNTSTAYYAFDAAAVPRILNDTQASQRVRRVFVARGLTPFKTESCAFDVWTAGTTDEHTADPMESIEPRRLVYEAKPGTVPWRVGDLLLKGEWPTVSSPAFTAWKNVVARRLPYTLSNEVRVSDTSTELVFRGARSTVVPIDPAVSAGDEVVRVEMEIGQWIFAGGPGVENRHVFFTTELGRIWPDKQTWADGIKHSGPLALEGAKSANSLMLSGKTSDVLKALGDIRKTMTDEATRLGQQTRDLGAALWRDFVVAVAALSARAAVTSPDAAVELGLRFLVGLAVIFLAYSLWVTISANQDALRISNANRKEWRSRVYQFVSDTEMNALFNQPLKDSEESYGRTQFRVLIAYAVMSMVLLLSATWQQQWTTNLQQVMRPSASVKALVPVKAPVPNKSSHHTATCPVKPPRMQDRPISASPSPSHGPRLPH